MSGGDSKQGPRLSFSVHVGLRMFDTLRTQRQEQALIQRGEDEVWRQELVPDTE